MDVSLVNIAQHDNSNQVNFAELVVGSILFHFYTKGVDDKNNFRFFRCAKFNISS